MTITVFDHGAGNLHSLVKALDDGTGAVRVSDDARVATRSTLLVLPGVGGFGAAATRLAPARDHLRGAIADGLPCLGVCLGMQLLFERSAEGPGLGLGVFAGDVTRLTGHRVPHMGWNTLESAPGHAPQWPTTVYFAHGYVCVPADPGIVTAWATHERQRFAAMVRSGRIAGVQFHPEKSGRAGVRSLRGLARALTDMATEAA